MGDLFWLSDQQFRRIKPHLLADVRGVPRVDDRKVLSGIVHAIKRGLRWSDCPPEYGPAKAIYNRYARCSERGIYTTGGSNELVDTITRLPEPNTVPLASFLIQPRSVLSIKHCYVGERSAALNK